eukprot:CAMPEP_0195592264 /NCGR_PEP_ID=MMETSP0815-20121206/259_1 /TAXON_ID=97485 /ORGANISM="Prymnesium parvum, Strain Texoma1" /LENGTH=351 /DNA_ID=CAMNT_0040731327 /DNA_START=136 /DNA_END=1188 /DNA_ORIENTATION=+
MRFPVCWFDWIEDIHTEGFGDLARHAGGGQLVAAPEILVATANGMEFEGGHHSLPSKDLAERVAVLNHKVYPVLLGEEDGRLGEHELPALHEQRHLPVEDWRVVPLVVGDDVRRDRHRVIRRDDPLDVAVGCEQHALPRGETVGQAEVRAPRRHQVPQRTLRLVLRLRRQLRRRQLEQIAAERLVDLAVQPVAVKSVLPPEAAHRAERWLGVGLLFEGVAEQLEGGQDVQMAEELSNRHAVRHCFNHVGPREVNGRARDAEDDAVHGEVHLAPVGVGGDQLVAYRAHANRRVVEGRDDALQVSVGRKDDTAERVGVLNEARGGAPHDVAKAGDWRQGGFWHHTPSRLLIAL